MHIVFWKRPAKACMPKLSKALPPVRSSIYLKSWRTISYWSWVIMGRLRNFHIEDQAGIDILTIGSNKNLQSLKFDISHFTNTAGLVFHNNILLSLKWQIHLNIFLWFMNFGKWRKKQTQKSRKKLIYGLKIQNFFWFGLRRVWTSGSWMHNFDDYFTLF